MGVEKPKKITYFDRLYILMSCVHSPFLWSGKFAMVIYSVPLPFNNEWNFISIVEEGKGIKIVFFTLPHTERETECVYVVLACLHHVVMPYMNFKVAPTKCRIG